MYHCFIYFFNLFNKKKFYKKFSNTINLFNYNHLNITCAIKYVTKLKKSYFLIKKIRYKAIFLYCYINTKAFTAVYFILLRYF